MTALPQIGLIDMATWLLLELCWWWLFATALALVTGLLLGSTAAQAMFPRRRFA